MQAINSIQQDTKNHSIDAHSLSRREFIKLTLVASGGLSLWLAGCAPVPTPVVEDRGPLAVVDKWIQALNAEDASGFKQLHSESVLATTHNHSDPFSGREQVWDSYSTSTGNQLEKIAAFSQGQSVCLLVNATKFNRSLCYVFNLVDGVIARVYEYSSGRYDLANSEQFSGIEISGDDTGLQDRLDIMDNIFVEGLNNRDFSVPGASESVMFFVPTSTEPVIGRERFDADGKEYALFFPDVRHTKIQSFGRGDLVCLHVAAERTSKGSLCFVAVFQGEEIAELYEFWSDARVDV